MGTAALTLFNSPDARLVIRYDDAVFTGTAGTGEDDSRQYKLLGLELVNKTGRNLRVTVQAESGPRIGRNLNTVTTVNVAFPGTRFMTDCGWDVSFS